MPLQKIQSLQPYTAIPAVRWQQLMNATVMLLTMLIQSPVFAQDHIIERAWMEDPSRQMSWQDVQKQPLQSFQGVLSKGFGHSVIWMRLRIDPYALPSPRRDSERLVLRIRPVYLDDIRVFDASEPQGLAKITGNQYHPRTDELQGLDFLVPIDGGTAPRNIWLSVESTSTRQIVA